MLFLGVLSVFQLLVIPGLLIIRLFPGRRGLIQNSVYVFMLSLLANYAGVFFLTSLSLYSRAVVFVILLLEIGLLIWLGRGRLQAKPGWGEKIQRYVSTGTRYFSDWLSKDFWVASLYFLFGLVALVGIAWLLWVWVNNFDTAYQAWDSWASWDRWATKWADNRFPADTWEYPQLIPTSLSLSFKFIGTTAVKFFGKSIMPLFAVVMGLMLFDLGRKNRSLGYMLGAGLAVYSINFFLGKYLSEVYADIPVACFSLMAIYTLLSAEGIHTKQENKHALMLGFLASATAAVTKQTGLYILAFYPVLAYFWILRRNKKFAKREALAFLSKGLLLALVIVVPWYIFIEYRILFAGASSNIQYVITDIYDGLTLPERFVTAIVSLKNFAFVFLFALLSIPVLDKRYRYILILLVLPFSILWAFFLSYEPRNLAVALPLVSASAGLAAEAWVLRARRFFHSRVNLNVPAFAILLLVLIVVGSITIGVDNESITQHQINQQRQIFEPLLNEKLYRYFSYAEGPEEVITSYPIGWLPDLEDLWINERFEEYESYQQTLINHPSVELLLVPVFADPQILDEIFQGVEGGSFQRIFTEANYMLIRIPPRLAQ